VLYRDQDAVRWCITEDGKRDYDQLSDAKKAQLSSRHSAIVCVYTSDSVGGDWEEFSRDHVRAQLIVYKHERGTNSVLQNAGRFRCRVDGNPEATRQNAMSVPLTYILSDSIFLVIPKKQTDIRIKFLERAEKLQTEIDLVDIQDYIEYKIIQKNSQILKKMIFGGSLITEFIRQFPRDPDQDIVREFIIKTAMPLIMKVANTTGLESPHDFYAAVKRIINRLNESLKDYLASRLYPDVSRIDPNTDNPIHRRLLAIHQEAEARAATIFTEDTPLVTAATQLISTYASNDLRNTTLGKLFTALDDLIPPQQTLEFFLARNAISTDFYTRMKKWDGFKKLSIDQMNRILTTYLFSDGLYEVRTVNAAGAFRAQAAGIYSGLTQKLSVHITNDVTGRGLTEAIIQKELRDRLVQSMAPESKRLQQARIALPGQFAMPQEINIKRMHYQRLRAEIETHLNAKTSPFRSPSEGTPKTIKNSRSSLDTPHQKHSPLNRRSLTGDFMGEN
jgi:hypothetical protein